MRRIFFSGAVLLTAMMIPLSVMAGNQQMAENVASVLQDSGLVDDCEIGLKYQDGTVWLTGSVEDVLTKQRIEKMVADTEGVHQVINHLDVTAKSDPQVRQVARFERQMPVGERVVDSRIISDELISVTDAQGRPVSDACLNGVTLESSVDQNMEPAVSSASPSDPKVVKSSMPNVRPMNVSMASQNSVSVVPAGNSPKSLTPVAYGTQTVTDSGVYSAGGCPLPMNAQAYNMPTNGGAAMRYNQPNLPRYAWPTTAAYSNTAAIQYPKRYTHKAFPFIGPFYPYPQVPDGWRKITVEWHDGYWHVDYDDGSTKGPFSGLFRMKP